MTTGEGSNGSLVVQGKGRGFQKVHTRFLQEVDAAVLAAGQQGALAEREVLGGVGVLLGGGLVLRPRPRQPRTQPVEREKKT